MSKRRAVDPSERKTLRDAFDTALKSCSEREGVDIPDYEEILIWEEMIEAFDGLGYGRFTEDDSHDGPPEKHDFHPDAFKSFEELITPWVKALKEAQELSRTLGPSLAKKMVESNKMKRFKDASSDEDNN